MKLDAVFRTEVNNFVYNWNVVMENKLFHDTMPDGKIVTDTWGEIMRHVIAHEIHHVGQISVWAREEGKACFCKPYWTGTYLIRMTSSKKTIV